MESSGIIAVLPEGDILPMTHVDGLAILDEYFEQPVIGAGPADGTASLVNYPMNSGESSGQGRALEVTPDFNATRSEPHLQTVEKDAIPDSFDEPTPDLAAASAVMSESGSTKGPFEVASLVTNPTSNAFSEAYINNNLLGSDLQHPTVLKRAVLDESAKWIEDILMALEKVENTSRKPNNSVLERVDLVFTESEVGQYVKIMIEIAENVVKCTRCMAKPELDVLLSWNRVYEPPLRQLAARIIAEEEDDFSRQE